MKNTYKIAIVIASVSVLAVFIKMQLSKNDSKFDSPTPAPKDEFIKIIIQSKNASNEEVLKNFDKEYLSSWANAILQKKLTFINNGILYRVKGGTRI